MSDDTPLPPSSLRLKPRARIDTPIGEAGSAGVEGPRAAPADDAGSLPLPSGEVPAPATPAPAVLPLPDVLVPAPLAPNSSGIPPSGEMIDLGRLKLKPRGAALDPAAVKTLVPAVGEPTSYAPPPAAPPPSLPATTSPKSSVSAANLSGLPPLSPAAAKAPELMPAVKTGTKKTGATSLPPEQSPAFRAGIWAFGTLVVMLLGGIGFLGYRFLTKPAKKPVPVTSSASAAAKKVAEAPVPIEASPLQASETTVARKSVLATDHPESLQGKLVAKAEQTIAAREQGGQVAGMDDVLGEDAARTKPAAAPTVTPPPEPQKPAPATTATVGTPASPASDVEPAPAATEVAVPVEPIVRNAPKPKPGQGFRVFVVNSHVTGVFQGEPGRVLLNGRMFRVGELVEPQLGIRLVRLDTERKILHFEDIHGAQMDRRY